MDQKFTHKMLKGTVSKLFNSPYKVILLLCSLLLSVGGVFLLITIDRSQEEVQLSANAPSAIPYVTDTKEFFEYLRSTLNELGPESVQVHIKKLYEDAEHGEQHMAFHYLGEVFYETIGTQAFPLCKDWYGYGCFHGLILDAVDAEGYQVVPFLDEACSQANSSLSDIETCQHGIGHGLLEFTGRDPFEAIEACDLVNDVYPKLGCASGVFMEYFSPTQALDSRVRLVPEFDEQDPFDVCNDFTGLRMATCLFEMHSWQEGAGELSPRDVEALCNSVQDQEAREFCLIGYGNAKGPVLTNAIPYCDQFVEPESLALCRAGVLWAAEHFYDPQDSESACRDLPGEYQALCFDKGRFTCELENNCQI